MFVSRPAIFRFSYDGNRYSVPHGQVRLACRTLVLSPTLSGARTSSLSVDLSSGRVDVTSGAHARRALVVTPEMLAFATASGTRFDAQRNPTARSTTAQTANNPIVTALVSDQGVRINTRIYYTAISDRRGLRIDIWPFSITRLQRPTTQADRLPPYWADGASCAVGCSGAAGWPMHPFHQQHAIRSAINELRPANFHVAVDIEAQDFQAIYAIQSGYASASATGSYGDYKVTVGPYTYYHVVPAVASGQFVQAYRTIIGNVEHGFGHIAFEEGGNGNYLNPLRPGGPLRPYADTEPPIIGRPQVFADGRVIVGAFAPQSYVQRESYETPVLAPAALAWRLYDAKGHSVTGLNWALRSTGYLSPGLRTTVFGPGASNPGFHCFYTQQRCIPNWTYYLAGGLTSVLPLASLPHGRYRLAVYAWNWTDRRSALDEWIHVPVGRSAAPRSSEFGAIYPKIDFGPSPSSTPPMTAPFTTLGGT
jgi:hypothetical protein